MEEDGAACEDLAVDLAYTFEEAKARRKEAWAVAADLSKAYDRVPLEVLTEGLRDMGLPKGLWGPLTTMAATPRRIKAPDADTVGCMRRWVLHACYRGTALPKEPCGCSLGRALGGVILSRSGV